jgi:hypothetical protein
MPSHFIIHNFVGRNRELEVLRNIPAEAKSGDAAGIFLSGRNGIGKTELLRQAYHHYFNDQNDAIPFFYTMKTALTSIEHFAKDYFCSFVVQSLSFLKKDISMIDACIYSFEDVVKLAKESGVQWVAGVADDFEQARKGADPLNLFLSAISTPYRCYLITGTPVIVIIDDFHKMRKFCEINAVRNNRDFWMLFETPVKSRYTPHIFTGNQAELNRMFFEDSLLGEYLELFSVSGLRPDDTAKYFAALCETYKLDVRLELVKFIELFGGSPYYIKNFVQAARQASMVLSEENFWLVYLSEITKGKTFKYWTSLLKTYVPQFDLRKPSLRFLYRLCNNTSPVTLADLPDEISVRQEDLEQVIGLLNTSGVVETGFSEFELADDGILIDIIKGLYLREVGTEPWSRVKEIIISEKSRQAQPDRTPSFTLTIPATEKAEFVAVRTVEYVAQNFNIPPAITGQLQIALADLFSNVIGSAGKGAGNYFLKFKLRENVFFAEISIPSTDIVFTDADRERIGAYLDSLSVESTAEGTKIILLRDISKDSVSAS